MSWSDDRGNLFNCSVGEEGTTGEAKKGSTVGRRTDLPWVGETTYSRFFRRPTVGRFWGAPSPLFMRAGGGLRNSVRERVWEAGHYMRERSSWALLRSDLPSIEAPKEYVRRSVQVGTRFSLTTCIR